MDAGINILEYSGIFPRIRKNKSNKLIEDSNWEESSNEFI